MVRQKSKLGSYLLDEYSWLFGKRTVKFRLGLFGYRDWKDGLLERILLIACGVDGPRISRGIFQYMGLYWLANRISIDESDTENENRGRKFETGTKGYREGQSTVEYWALYTKRQIYTYLLDIYNSRYNFGRA